MTQADSTSVLRRSLDSEPVGAGQVIYCVRCQRIADNPVMVGFHEAATGPGANVYSCEACAS